MYRKVFSRIVFTVFFFNLFFSLLIPLKVFAQTVDLPSTGCGAVKAGGYYSCTNGNTMTTYQCFNGNTNCIQKNTKTLDPNNPAVAVDPQQTTDATGITTKTVNGTTYKCSPSDTAQGGQTCIQEGAMSDWGILAGLKEIFHSVNF
jgi:hypothetical protein